MMKSPSGVGGARWSVALCIQRLHLKQKHAATRLCFNSNSRSPRHLISPPSDHHLSASIRASGSLHFHVVPIIAEQEVATVFGHGGALAPGEALLAGLESPLVVCAVL